MKKYGLDSGEIHFSDNEEIPISGSEARLERGWQSRCRPLLGPLPWPLLPWLATSSAAGTQSYCSTISLKTCCREVEDEDKEEEEVAASPSKPGNGQEEVVGNSTQVRSKPEWGNELDSAEVEVDAKKLEEKRVDPSNRVVDEKENTPRAQLKILIPIPAEEEGSPGEKEEEENKEKSTKDQEDLAMLLMSAKD